MTTLITSILLGSWSYREYLRTLPEADAFRSERIIKADGYGRRHIMAEIMKDLDGTSDKAAAKVTAEQFASTCERYISHLQTTVIRPAKRSLVAILVDILWLVIQHAFWPNATLSWSSSECTFAQLFPLLLPSYRWYGASFWLLLAVRANQPETLAIAREFLRDTIRSTACLLVALCDVLGSALSLTSATAAALPTILQAEEGLLALAEHVTPADDLAATESLVQSAMWCLARKEETMRQRQAAVDRLQEERAQEDLLLLKRRNSRSTR